ncbi:hypothetical protein HZH68_009010 [Vespula germanica]|nr:hypothetical protein HZH68_009010 [Vespula germanica]
MLDEFVETLTRLRSPWKIFYSYSKVSQFSGVFIELEGQKDKRTRKQRSPMIGDVENGFPRAFIRNRRHFSKGLVAVKNQGQPLPNEFPQYLSETAWIHAVNFNLDNDYIPIFWTS